MKNSYLITILTSFSKKEAKDFKKWLNSPMHNQREDVEDLFSYLIASNHLYDDKYLQKERIFKKVFPRQAYDDAKLRQTIHFLTKAVEEFLVFNQWRSDDLNFQLTLSNIFRKRDLEKAFKKSIKITNNKKEDNSLRNADYFWNEFIYQSEIYSFTMQKGKRQAIQNFKEISDALDLSYISNKIKYLCLVVSQKAIVNTNYDIQMVDVILKQIEERSLYDIPSIGVYYYIYRATTAPQELEHYNKLKSIITNQYAVFPKHELDIIVKLVINYCTAKMNKGLAQFRRDAFEFQKMWIEKGLFKADNVMDPHVFRNIVVSGCIQKEFDWVNNLIENYKDFLPPAQKDKVAHFCKAIYFFIKGDYDDAQDLLLQFDYDDNLLTAQAKSMLIRLYYEQDEFDLLEAQLESTRTYLHRKKIMGYRREQWMNLIRLTKKLIKINPYNEDHRKKLEGEILNAKPFPEQRWLLSRLAEL